MVSETGTNQNFAMRWSDCNLIILILYCIIYSTLSIGLNGKGNGLYYLGQDQSLYGPYPVDDIVRWYEEGYIPSDLPITWNPDQSEYFPLSSLLSLATDEAISIESNAMSDSVGNSQPKLLKPSKIRKAISMKAMKKGILKLKSKLSHRKSKIDAYPTDEIRLSSSPIAFQQQSTPSIDTHEKPNDDVSSFNAAPPLKTKPLSSTPPRRKIEKLEPIQYRIKSTSKEDLSLWNDYDSLSVRKSPPSNLSIALGTAGQYVVPVHLRQAINELIGVIQACPVTLIVFLFMQIGSMYTRTILLRHYSKLSQQSHGITPAIQLLDYLSHHLERFQGTTLINRVIGYLQLVRIVNIDRFLLLFIEIMLFNSAIGIFQLSLVGITWKQCDRLCKEKCINLSHLSATMIMVRNMGLLGVVGWFLYRQLGFPAGITISVSFLMLGLLSWIALGKSYSTTTVNEEGTWKAQMDRVVYLLSLQRGESGGSGSDSVKRWNLQSYVHDMTETAVEQLQKSLAVSGSQLRFKSFLQQPVSLILILLANVISFLELFRHWERFNSAIVSSLGHWMSFIAPVFQERLLPYDIQDTLMESIEQGTFQKIVIVCLFVIIQRLLWKSSVKADRSVHSIIGTAASKQSFTQQEQDVVIQLMRDYIQPSDSISILNEVTQDQLLSRYAEKSHIGIAIQGLDLVRNNQSLIHEMKAYFRPGEINVIIDKQSERPVDELLDSIYYRHDDSIAAGIQYRGRRIAEFNQREWEQRITYLRDHEPPLYLHAATVAGIVNGMSDKSIEQHLEAAKLTGVKEIMQSLPFGVNTLLKPSMITTGQWKLFALCRALTNIDRDIILLTNPFDGLSSGQQQQLLDFIRRNIQSHQTVIISSRDDSLVKDVHHVFMIQDHTFLSIDQIITANDDPPSLSM